VRTVRRDGEAEGGECDGGRGPEESGEAFGAKHFRENGEEADDDAANEEASERF
jgi:hypothetical protein